VLRTGLAWLSGQLVSLWISITTSLDTLLGASAALLKRPRVPIAAPEILSLILAGMVLLWLIGNGLLLRGVRPLLRSGTPRD
jgi:hypothetical protein